VSCGGGGSSHRQTLVVTSIVDAAVPPDGTVTLRSAVEAIESGGTITFAPGLDGGTIRLTIVGSDHSILVGESFPMGRFAGYVERDYGASALYARKNLTIDASDLPNGITLEWAGVDPARVLAVYGDLVLRNVSVTGGYSRGEPIPGGAQPHTLGRGGGIAVWGTAALHGCTVSGNRAEGDVDPSRDRGSFGGGIYGNRLVLTDCVVSGNSVKGYGAAGGGLYSVGGAGMPEQGSSLLRCSVAGNRVTGQHAYGGGVYSDGGGPGGSNTISFVNCTLARNLVEDNPDLGEPAGSQYYYRGGGIYMSNGFLRIESSTIAENAVTGHPAIFRGRPNMAGGGIAATIGNAHVVDTMWIEQSIVAGNTVNGAPHDLFSGSLVHFVSRGFNRIGRLDLGDMLVPVPPWWSLCRKHWPKVGDQDGVAAADVLDPGAAEIHPSVVSVGVDEGANVVLWIPPTGSALDRVPSGPYRLEHSYVQSEDPSGQSGNLLARVLEKLRTDYAAELGSDVGSGLGDVTGILFHDIPNVWPGEPENEPWIAFWRDLEAEIGDRLGAAGLAEDFWVSLGMDLMREGTALRVGVATEWIVAPPDDQRRRSRPAGGACDIGAIER
jgi:hypothetical protein